MEEYNARQTSEDDKIPLEALEEMNDGHLRRKWRSLPKPAREPASSGLAGSQQVPDMA